MRLSQVMSARRADRGFTLAEVLVSLMVIGFIFSALAATVMVSLFATVKAERLVQATALRTDVIDTLRAIPYDEAGLCGTTPAGYGDGGTGTTYNGEEIVKLTTVRCDNIDPSRQIDPVQETTVQSVDYQVTVYVTRVDSDGNGIEDARRLTVESTHRNRSSDVTATSEVVRSPNEGERDTLACPRTILDALASPDPADLDPSNGKNLQPLELHVTTCGLGEEGVGAVKARFWIRDSSGTATQVEVNVPKKAPGLSADQRFQSIPVGTHMFFNGPQEITFTAYRDGVPTPADTWVATIEFRGGKWESPTGTNLRPTVNAGPDLIVAQDEAAPLNASASDDGQPDPPAALTYQWSVVSGNPAHVVFSDDTALQPTVTFTVGNDPAYVTYELMLEVSDGALTERDRMTASVTGTATLNTPPAADAGADRSAEAAATFTLDDATASDDDGDPFTVGWSTQSGPDSAMFSDPAALNPDVTLPQVGTYVLRMTVSDGKSTSTDAVTVTATAPIDDVSIDLIHIDPDTICVHNNGNVNGTLMFTTTTTGLTASDRVTVTYVAGNNQQETAPAPLESTDGQTWKFLVPEGEKFKKGSVTRITFRAQRLSDGDNATDDVQRGVTSSC